MTSIQSESDSIELLTSIFPSHSTEEIIKYFNASNKNLERTSLALLNCDQSNLLVTTEFSKNKVVGTKKRKSSEGEGLGNWLGITKKKSTLSTSSTASTNTTATSTSSLSASSSNSKLTPSTSSTPIKSAFSVLRSEPLASTSTSNLPTSSSSSSSSSSNHSSPLILGTEELINLHTNGLCTLIPNVLEKSLASKLFLRMVKDSLGEEIEIDDHDEEEDEEKKSGGSGKGKGKGKGKKKKRVGGWEKNRWYLFDREVSSPHTTAFYVEGEGKGKGVTSTYDQAAFAEAAQYWYNGEKRSASIFNAEMEEAREIIGPIVRNLLATRPKKSSLEFKGDWIPNVSAANCYRGSKESVGWHADVLSYLGPYPTIASLSLGVSRPFRLRLSAPSSSSSPNRTLEIQLPHNSLLIMHAGVQELFKHTVPEVKAVDTFRIWKGLHLSREELEKFSGVGGEGGERGLLEELKERRWTERINMTFRFYRPDFAPIPSTPTSTTSISTSTSQFNTSAPSPSSNYKGTPMCSCKLPTQLRADAKHKVAERFKSTSSTSTSISNLNSSGEKNTGEEKEKEEEKMLFFWTCNGGAQNKGKGCGYFELLNMEKEGRGNWWKGNPK